jgi:hypothetical protein
MTKREEGLQLIQMAGYLHEPAKVAKYCLEYRISKDVGVKHYIEGRREFFKNMKRRNGGKK